MASAIRGVQDLIVEHREVERKAKADRMGGRQILIGYRRCRRVGFESLGGALLSDIGNLELGEVAMVVTLHFVIKYFAFLGFRVRDEIVFNNLCSSN
jgi:hypothetical protein